MSGVADGVFKRKAAPATKPKVKQFTDVDTDSSDENDHVARRSLPSLSFKTEKQDEGGKATASLQMKSSGDEDDSTILFESDEDTRSAVSPPPKLSKTVSAVPPPPSAAKPQPQTALAPSPAAAAPKAAPAAAPPAAAASAKKAPVKTVAPAPASTKKTKPAPPSTPQAPATPTVSTPSPQYLDVASPPPVLPPPQALNTHDDDDDQSDGFAEEVLPRDAPPRQALPSQPTPRLSQPQPPQPQPAVRPTYPAALRSPPRERAIAPQPSDPVEDVLVRAQLRLEEKRRTETALATPLRGRLPSPRVSTGTPLRAYSSTPRQPMLPVSSSAMRDTQASQLLPPPGPPQLDAKVRRLLQENNRLQEEVAFLSSENQKLRTVAGASDAAENMRLQLTVEMLRKELHGKEVDHQRSVADLHSRNGNLEKQMGELVEQAEGYASSAEQYRQLYGEKIKELEQLKSQFQSLMQEVNTIEQRQRSGEQQHQEGLAAEREKTHQALQLLADVKVQREHLQELNAQLESEVRTATEARQQAKEEARTAAEALRRNQETTDRRLAVYAQDTEKLKEALQEKERIHSAQLREEQRLRGGLQQRLNEADEEAKSEAERQRRLVEAARDDAARALQAERERRMEVEDKLRRAEADGKAAVQRVAESVQSEQEQRIKRMRDEIAQERQLREGAQREADRLARENVTLHESLQYYQQECQALADSFTHSEQLREKAEQQCAAATSTLEDLMAHDEQQSKAVDDLQHALDEAQSELEQLLGRGHQAGTAIYDLQQLSDENERLTGECVRIAGERDALIEENGKIAEELLKWKNEMRQFVASRAHSSSAAKTQVRF